MRCVWKVTGLGILYELWAKEGLANCVIIWHDILQVCNCNLCLLQLLNFFTCVCIQLISFLFHFQMNTKQRMMNTKHRTNLKFLVHLGKTPSQALEMLKQVYGDNTVSWTRVSVWHKRFKEGCKEVEDDSKSWRPSTSRTQVNIELVKQSAWQSSVDCSNDCKSAGHKKGQCLEDSLKIWACRKSVQKCCQDCWMMTRRSVACRCVRTSFSDFKMNQTCLEESSLVMRLGFLITTGKPSARALNGKVWRCQGQRKQGSQSQKSKSCWSHSSMWEALSTVSSCHRARKSISKFTERSCGIYFAQCARRDKGCGMTNCGCFTMTMHLLTMPWASNSSWLRRTSSCWNNLPIHLTLFHMTFFFSPSSRGSSRGPVLKTWRPSRGL